MFSYLKIYSNPRILSVVLLGISGGFPLLLVGSTLDRWLLEQGISKTSIGLFAALSLPFTIKFLWAPLIDHLHLPYFSKRFGHRKSWTILTQIFLIISIIALGHTNPSENLLMTGIAALFVSFCAASQDIVIQALRIEILNNKQQAAGSANIVLGYRIGLLISGAGALYLAELFPWSVVFTLVSFTTIIGMITTFFLNEPDVDTKKILKQHDEKFSSFIIKATILPFKDFTKKPHWLSIIILMLIYKAGEILLSKMSMPFYTELGFSKSEIASVTKIYGLFAIIIGGLIGGVIASKFGILRGMMICGVPQMLTNLFYVILAYIGYDVRMLMIAVTFDNLTAGMATACLVALLSRLCTKGMTATQYALLSSFTGLSHKFFGMLSGFLADHMNWETYFMLTTIACLPGLYLLGWLMVKNNERRFLAMQFSPSI